VLQIGKGERFDRLVLRLARSAEPLATTIVNVEEQMRGWLAALAKEKRPERQVKAYRELAELFERFAKFIITPFDEAASAKYTELRTGRGHLGTRDLKIASITVTNNALLLTANNRDFEQVPGLRFENWMDP
jgi:tRNA(fMet)-specific endonuclease VapC